MASSITEKLLAGDADLSHVHRRVVRVGAAAAWAATAMFLLAGMVGNNDAMLIEAVGPTLAASFMTAQILLRKENGAISMLAAATVTMVMYSAVGNEDLIVPAALALVIIGSIGVLLVESHRLAVLGGVALFMFTAPLWWNLSTGRAIQLGTVMALALVMTALILMTIRNSAASLNARFQTLFESSPGAVMEEDWSRSVAYLREEYTGRPDRIRAFLMAYPAVVRRAVSMARILRVNDAAVDLLEANGPDDLIGFRDGSKITDLTLEAFAEGLVALYEGRDAHEYEMLAATLTGKHIWLQVRCVDTSTSTPGTNVIVGMADISHIKERQEAMADLVKAKDEFVAKVSHELRTPLTAVVGLSSELATMDGLSDEESRELMQLVAGQAREMSYIVDDLLVAARADLGTVAIDPVDVDLGYELRATIEGLGVGLEEMPDGLPEVYADPSRVRQILRNLLTNAHRYGGPHSRVLGGVIFDKVWLEVRDDGEGVGREDAARIFEPYATAHTGVKGSVGLGLSVARQLAELMGGSLTYHRDLDETVFRLELPAAENTKPFLTSKKVSV